MERANMSDNVTEVSYSASKSVLSVVIGWGFSNDIFVLFILIKSSIYRDVKGQFMLNEVIADMSLHITTAFIIVAGAFTQNVTVALALGTAFADIKCFSLMGLSIVLSIAICNPFRYMVYISVKKVRIYLAITWLFVPAVLCYVLLEGTYYKVNENSKRMEPNNTSQNWWVGALNLSGVVFIPFIVIVVCVVKIVQRHKRELGNKSYLRSAAENKIRLAKLNTIVFVFHVLSQLPFHIAVSLHTDNHVTMGVVSFLFFSYPSMKLFIYLLMMRNFRRTALKTCPCVCRKKTNHNAPTATYQSKYDSSEH